MLGGKPLSHLRLCCRESKKAAVIAPNYEPQSPVAHRAVAVKEDDRMICR
jgi:hypothetical protein